MVSIFIKREVEGQEQSLEKIGQKQNLGVLPW